MDQRNYVGIDVSARSLEGALMGADRRSATATFANTPAARFKDHEEGHKANRYACCYGLWLRKRLFQHYNPMTYDEAVKKEVKLAERLRKKGHVVWQK